MGILICPLVASSITRRATLTTSSGEWAFREALAVILTWGVLASMEAVICMATKVATTEVVIALASSTLLRQDLATQQMTAVVLPPTTLAQPAALLLEAVREPPLARPPSTAQGLALPPPLCRGVGMLVGGLVKGVLGPTEEVGNYTVVFSLGSSLVTHSPVTFLNSSNTAELPALQLRAVLLSTVATVNTWSNWCLSHFATCCLSVVALTSSFF